MSWASANLVCTSSTFAPSSLKAPSRGGGRSRSRARAARVHGEVPGIVRVAGEGAAAERLPAEFRSGGLAGKDASRFLETPHEGRIVVGNAVREEMRPPHGTHA